MSFNRTVLICKRVSLSILLAAVALIITAKAAHAQQITQVIQWTDSLHLEESSDVVTVAPEATVDPNGGFIVTDTKEAQVRLYDTSGRLISYFGRQGRGTGELRTPFAAIRLSSNQILVPQFRAGLSLFGADGQFVKQDRDAFAKALQVHVLPGNGSDILVVGSRENWRQPERTSDTYPLLHRFDVESGEVRQSFFLSPLQPGSYSNVLYVIGYNAAADVRDDRIAAAFAPLSKLYFFDLSGSLINEVDVPSRHFRQIEKPEKETLSSQEIFDYSTRFSSITDVYWLRDDVILLQYYDLLDRSTWTLRWNLIAVTPEGELLFDLADTPQLLAVNKETGELFFSHPDHTTENHWIVGQLKELSAQSR